MTDKQTHKPELDKLVDNIKDLCNGENNRPESIRELERRIPVSENTVHRWRVNAPSYIVVLKAAKILGTTVERLSR